MVIRSIHDCFGQGSPWLAILAVVCTTPGVLNVWIYRQCRVHWTSVTGIVSTVAMLPGAFSLGVALNPGLKLDPDTYILMAAFIPFNLIGISVQIACVAHPHAGADRLDFSLRRWLFLAATLTMWALTLLLC